jgi:hypothetical protein
MLCKTCTVMFESSECGSHHPDLASFSAAAESGCYICRPLLRSITEKLYSLENSVLEPTTYRVIDYGTAKHVIIDLTMLENEEKTLDWAIFVTTSAFGLHRGLDVYSRVSSIPVSETVPRVQEWMSTCLENHTCQKNTHPSIYPTRLLQLGLSSFRIISTGKETPTGPYAALSYCWGPDPTFLQLTASNRETLEAGISYTQLPLAFQESIKLLQMLSIRYIWIDSLCIMQRGHGSIEDWQQESAKMHEVYSNSILTLALSSSSNPNNTSLRGYSSDAIPPFDMESDTVGKYTVMSIKYFARALYGLPLGCRAWGLQERLTSTRIVSFGLGELFWDCAQVPNACESFPSGLGATELREVLDMFDLADKSIPITTDYDTLTGVWWRLLQEYTQRELTYPEDKLVALSAVAKDMGERMNDVYIVGHFLKMLPESLNWTTTVSWPDETRWSRRAQRISGFAETSEDTSQLKTPSWSWASMHGPIYRWTSTNEHSLSLADTGSYALNLVNDATPTGDCISASLDIWAYCTEIEWRDGNPHLLARSDSWIARNCGFQCDLDETERIQVDGTRMLLAALSQDDWLKTWSGLLIGKIDDPGNPKYSRMGHFEISKCNIEGSTWWDERNSLFEKDRRLITLI